MALPRHRRLANVSAMFTRYSGYTYLGVHYPGIPVTTSFVDLQNVDDEIHDWPLPENRKSQASNVGGPFLSVNYTQDHGALQVRAWNDTVFHDYYTGPQFARIEGADATKSLHVSLWWNPPPQTSSAEMSALGTTAISRCAPTNPHASVAQAIGEIRRDGIPSIPGFLSFKKGPRPRTVSRKRGRRSAQAGNEFLNVEFGLKPFLNDVRKIAMSSRDSEKVLSQYMRDSGKLIRRHYEFPIEETVETTAMGESPAYPALNNRLYVRPKGVSTKTTVTTRRRWFDGAFTYYVAPDDELFGARRFAQEANHLLGVGITPGVVWDLLPWSWALDWVGNMGDVLNNVSMYLTDGLVVVYGYIMVETTRKVTYDNVGCTLTNVPPMNLSQSFTTVIKQRQVATPFGFGLNTGAFTSRQWSIIAALGLTQNGSRIAK